MTLILPAVVTNTFCSGKSSPRVVQPTHQNPPITAHDEWPINHEVRVYLLSIVWKNRSMSETLTDILYSPDGNWDEVENFLSSCQSTDITQNGLYMVLRRKSFFSSGSRRLQTVDYSIPAYIVHTMIQKNPDILDRNVLHSVFGTNPTTSTDIISILLEVYCKSSPDLKNAKHWKGKFLCDVCFGYCPVNIEAVGMFIQRFPEALSYAESSNLLPIHKACQLKFRRRAKQESLRDSKTLLKVILCETIKRQVFNEVDSIGGLFKSINNNVGGMTFLVNKLGEDTAFDWVINALKDFDNVPILQAVLKFRCKNRKRIIRRILVEFHSPLGAIRDGKGNLPLHVAISEGVSWYDGLEEIMEAYPNATEISSSEGYIPFISMIMSNLKFHVSSIYSFVRFNPEFVLKSVHKKKDKYDIKRG